jgi:hypothetical protein
LRVSITDFSTGEQGTMMANAAHGFEQVVFDPSATSCTLEPYTFRAMFSTSSERTRVIWTAHTYNVAFSMEIGHQTKEGYTNAPNGDSTFMGPSYVHDWPGSLPPSTDFTVHAGSIAFPSPLFVPSGALETAQYKRVAFEADMPEFEADDQNCVTPTGVNCTNPPNRAQFYPIYSAAQAGPVSCVWHFGDTQIPNTTDLFGGDSTAEFGTLLKTFYPGFGGPVDFGFDFENYHRTLDNNPCQYAVFIPPNVRTIPQPIPTEEIIFNELLIIEEEIGLFDEGVPINQVVRFGEALNEFLIGSILETEFGTGPSPSSDGITN